MKSESHSADEKVKQDTLWVTDTNQWLKSENLNPVSLTPGAFNLHPRRNVISTQLTPAKEIGE